MQSLLQQHAYELCSTPHIHHKGGSRNLTRCSWNLLELSYACNIGSKAIKGFKSCVALTMSACYVSSCTQLKYMIGRSASWFFEAIWLNESWWHTLKSYQVWPEWSPCVVGSANRWTIHSEWYFGHQGYQISVVDWSSRSGPAVVESKRSSQSAGHHYTQQ